MSLSSRGGLQADEGSAFYSLPVRARPPSHRLVSGHDFSRAAKSLPLLRAGFSPRQNTFERHLQLNPANMRFSPTDCRASGSTTKPHRPFPPTTVYRLRDCAQPANFRGRKSQ